MSKRLQRLRRWRESQRAAWAERQQLQQAEPPKPGAWADVAGLLVLAMLAPSLASYVIAHAGPPGVPDLGQVAFGGGLLVGYAWWRARGDRDPVATLGLRSGLGAYAILFGVFFALGIFLMAGIVQRGFELFGGAKALEHQDQSLDAFRAIPLHIALPMALCAGVYEEIVARGFLLDRLRKGLAYSGAPKGEWLPVLLGAWLFGLGHAYQGPIGVVKTFVAGLIFSFAASLDRGGVRVAIVAHVLVDSGSFLLLRYAE